MSNTTINMRAISKVSDINAHTVAKLYAHHGIDIPQYIDIANNNTHPAHIHDDAIISHIEVLDNITWHDEHHTTHHTCTHIVEELVLTQYMSINVEYIAE